MLVGIYPHIALSKYQSEKEADPDLSVCFVFNFYTHVFHI
jgi:hypothetical protein